MFGPNCRNQKIVFKNEKNGRTKVYFTKFPKANNLQDKATLSFSRKLTLRKRIILINKFKLTIQCKKYIYYASKGSTCTKDRNPPKLSGFFLHMTK